MVIEDWCKVLGKALDDGQFNNGLKGVIVEGQNDEIKSYVEKEAHVTLNDEDIGWLTKKVNGTDKSFLDLINLAREKGSMNGGSGRG